MKINQLELNVQVDDCSQDGGETLIWGHGLTASIQSDDLLGILEWETLSRICKLIRYDARGHGRSEVTYTPSDYCWNNLACDMVAIADEIGVKDFIAGGQSMGCATTIYAGIQASERIKGMILMNPPTAWETRSAQGAYYNKLARIGGFLGGNILAKIIARDLTRLLPAWLVNEKKDDVRGVLEGLKPIKRKALSSLFKGAGLTDLPSREEVKSIEIPALILAWKGDPSHPIETALELDRLLPQSRLHIAEGYSDLTEWSALIRNFVNDIGQKK